MKFDLFLRVVLSEPLPDDGLWPGDVGTVVHQHRASGQRPDGYEVEFFAANGDTVAVVSVSETALRLPTRQDRLAVRAV